MHTGTLDTEFFVLLESFKGRTLSQLSSKELSKLDHLVYIETVERDLEFKSNFKDDSGNTWEQSEHNPDNYGNRQASND